MDITKTLLHFSGLTGVSGQEDEVAAYGAQLLSAYGKVETTPLGSLVCTVREAKAGQPHLLWDAHMDEIGMIVTYIEEEGFLRVAGCGGVDRRLLLASMVTVHAADGPLAGIVCSMPPHLTGGKEKKNQKVDEVYIDVGFDQEEAAKRIHPGDRVTIQSRAREMFGGHVCGKAMDDRAGCVALLCGLEELGDKPLNCGLSVLFSTREEVGGQGARTAAYAVNPTHAIAVDVGYGHTPDAPREKTGELGKGPMIGFSPLLDREISDCLVRLAGERNIPFQRDVMGGRTGTNADQIVVTRCGVKSGLISIAEKYMHTPIEMVRVQDVELTGKLLAAHARSL